MSVDRLPSLYRGRSRRPVKVFFDGGSRPNPGAMETAVVAAGRTHIKRDLGEGTNLDAEWLALLHAVKIAQAESLGEYVLLGDAIAVVDRVNGTARSRGACRDHLAAFHALLEGQRVPRVRYIRRAHNLAGIALARLHPR